MSPPRAILHIDMDAFFASVEQLDHPELRGKAVLVGGVGGRGVVAAASYEARVHGARSAMPMHEARRRCPDAVVVPPRGKRYAEVSAQVFTIFSRYSPLVEGLSLDEAFIDVTGCEGLFGSPRQVALEIKAAIRDELGLTASAGIAPTKFAAKIASDLNKPDGLYEVQPPVEQFLSGLPISRMWGVGPKSVQRLQNAGIWTIGDLADGPESILRQVCGQHTDRIRALARGQDDRPVVPARTAKSIGSESTYDRDVHERSALEREILVHAAKVAARLTRAELQANVVRLKLKYTDFQVQTRQQKLLAPASDTDTLTRAGRALLDLFPLVRGVRLLGISAADLVPCQRQRQLFPDPDQARSEKLEKVREALSARYGDDSLTRATLLRPRPRSSE